MIGRRLAVPAGVTVLALALVGCSGAASPSTAPASAAPASAAPASAAPASAAPASAAPASAAAPSAAPASAAPAAALAALEAIPTGNESTHIRIAFFGFAKANSFAEATYAGIQAYAAAHNADVTFFDANFVSATQVAQIQDATTAGTYQVFIVQANDGAAVVPAVEAAIAKGIKVVAEFTPVGTRYDTAQSQVPGMIYIGDVPTENGKVLAGLGLQACGSLKPCIVAYLQGFQTLPLDNARTQATVAALQAGGATVISNYVGGYTQDQGRTVGQDLFTAHPDVNVVIGASQAIEGLETVIPASLQGKVKLVGNGASEQAVAAVEAGRWYGVFYLPEKTEGSLSAHLGLSAARGVSVPMSTDAETLFNVYGTKASLGNVTGDYKD